MSWRQKVVTGLTYPMPRSTSEFGAAPCATVGLPDAVRDFRRPSGAGIHENRTPTGSVRPLRGFHSTRGYMLSLLRSFFVLETNVSTFRWPTRVIPSNPRTASDKPTVARIWQPILPLTGGLSRRRRVLMSIN